jgi:hypothetical protein
MYLLPEVHSWTCDIAKLLTQHIEEKQTFQWSREAETAVWPLKGSLCTARVLGYLRLGIRA